MANIPFLDPRQQFLAYSMPHRVILSGASFAPLQTSDVEMLRRG
jgi:hypothetical protein